MTHKALIKRLETTCFGLDPIDPLRLLVDDVIAALAQPQRSESSGKPSAWVGLTDEEVDKAWRSVDYTVPWEQHRIDIAKAIEAKLKEKNNGGSKPRESP
jgi:hypothetical protein